MPSHNRLFVNSNHHFLSFHESSVDPGVTLVNKGRDCVVVECEIKCDSSCALFSHFLTFDATTIYFIVKRLHLFISFRSDSK